MTPEHESPEPASGDPADREPATGAPADRDPTSGGPAHHEPAPGGPAQHEPDAASRPRETNPFAPPSSYRSAVSGSGPVGSAPVAPATPGAPPYRSAPTGSPFAPPGSATPPAPSSPYAPPGIAAPGAAGSPPAQYGAPTPPVGGSPYAPHGAPGAARGAVPPYGVPRTPATAAPGGPSAAGTAGLSAASGATSPDGEPPRAGEDALLPLDSWGRPARRRRRRTLGLAWVVPLLVLSLLAGAAGGYLGERWLDRPRPADAALPEAARAGDPDAELTGVAGVAAQVLPSVVSIEVRSAQAEGTGSGFVLRDDGYILTNNHVVAGAGDGGEVVVVFADGSEEPAEVVGRTTAYDLAVLKVDRTGLTPLVLGDSDEVVVGDPVVAIGAPLGLQGTVTTGIVSALNRPVSAGGGGAQGGTAFINAIQTDAAINPGNSGGPLVDASGQVIGINSAIAQRPGAAASGSIGLGFAIPSNQARRTAEQLIETGSATYPVIGVLLDPQYTGEGVQVATDPQNGVAPVTADGPAQRAGIAPGDVIVAIDGRPVTEADELIVAIRAKAPGDSVTLTVRTGDDERDVRVVLDETTSESP